MVKAGSSIIMYAVVSPGEISSATAMDFLTVGYSPKKVMSAVTNEINDCKKHIFLPGVSIGMFKVEHTRFAPPMLVSSTPVRQRTQLY